MKERSKPRFIVDVMLGGLARWLRAMGYDTLYFNDIDDRELVRISRLEQRLLLTRDRRLVKERQLPAHLLVGANDTKG
ncbi:MAG: Mut7-C RNAse domain-containing protein, partial [Thermodesulfovibrionales bacterium]